MKFCASRQMRVTSHPWSAKRSPIGPTRDGVVLDDERAHGSQHNVNHSGTNEIVDEGQPLGGEASPEGGSGARPSSDVKYVST